MKKYCIHCSTAMTEIKAAEHNALVCTMCGTVIYEKGGSYQYGGSFEGSVPARRFIDDMKG